MRRPVQYFSEEYLDLCKKLSVEQIVQFVEGFRLLFGETANQPKLKQQEKIYLELDITDKK
ncbi:MAG TPA: hypothetical protein PK079_18475 [Leptospiraceae bacterium]|nr:hypothetical protein [Leptospiraceae bacterium]HMW07771.1 hypothetical protein [Leptospiraceae bacterium]HMX34942.1 hypothetical protein [Leptospiraceae bacterium]HMY34286.1 hypothetical protein [Leptospiraceae bacterium]HMZ64086.1 hypothetical protein [Leptospiraceae bacterium]